MLVLAIFAVVVSLGAVFLIYFFINLCRYSRKGHAIVFVECAQWTGQGQVSIAMTLINPNYDLTDSDRREVDQRGSQARPA